MRKPCTKCGNEYELDEGFYSHNGKHHAACKVCEGEARRERYQRNKGKELAGHYAWRAENREKVRGYDRARHQRNPNRQREYVRRYRERHPEKRKDSAPKYEYNITLSDRSAMCLLQGGMCAVCGAIPEKGLVVDHDHQTGQVRGMLCRECNIGLGHFKDNIPALRGAIRYLEEKGVRIVEQAESIGFGSGTQGSGTSQEEGLISAGAAVEWGAA